MQDEIYVQFESWVRAAFHNIDESILFRSISPLLHSALSSTPSDTPLLYAPQALSFVPRRTGGHNHGSVSMVGVGGGIPKSSSLVGLSSGRTAGSQSRSTSHHFNFDHESEEAYKKKRGSPLVALKDPPNPSRPTSPFVLEAAQNSGATSPHFQSGRLVGSLELDRDAKYFRSIT